MPIVDLIHALQSACVYPLKLAEKQLEQTKPRPFPKNLLVILLVATLTTLFGILWIHLELFMSTLLFQNKLISPILPEILLFLHHPIAIAMGLLIVPSIYVVNLMVDYRKDKKQFNDQLNIWKEESDIFKEQLDKFITGYGGIIREAILQSLKEAESHQVVKMLLDRSDPSNKDLQNQLERIRKETIDRIELLEKLTKLKSPIREVLSKMLDVDLMKEDWGPLYLTFAIQLQLSPWIDSRGNEPAYVFIRDIEEVKCLHTLEQDAKAEFRERLRKDLEVILSLVNGKLWSVMYKDILVWNEDVYVRSNQQLIERVKNRGTDLRRLFIYKTEWLNEVNILKALKKAAEWHIDSQYECRFIEQKDLKTTTSLINIQDETLVASCLINSTRIKMFQNPPLQLNDETYTPTAHRYDCNTKQSLVETYKEDFLFEWKKVVENGKPEKFLELIDMQNNAVEA